ncbi:MAG TPA: hypothetical protein VH813_08255 [Candidatus Limnocylindrales bacterium]
MDELRNPLATGMSARALRAAGVIHVALGVGFGLGAAISLDHLRRQGELPMTPWGFRALAGGPFDDLTPGAFTTLGWALVGVCVLDVLAGTWLWQGSRRGAVLGVATDAVALALGAGFALPFLLAGVPIRTTLLLAGRRNLR